MSPGCRLRDRPGRRLGAGPLSELAQAFDDLVRATGATGLIDSQKGVQSAVHTWRQGVGDVLGQRRRASLHALGQRTPHAAPGERVDTGQQAIPDEPDDISVARVVPRCTVGLLRGQPAGKATGVPAVV